MLFEGDSQSSNEEKKSCDGIVEEEGELGYYVSGKFVCPTNYTLECVGYASDNAGEEAKPEGFLINVYQKSKIEGK